MPMVIMNNAASMMALRVLGQNQLQVKKSTGRISSGTRINGAEDDTSSYSISERMKVRLRGLHQDEMNVSTGASMLKVAAGGIENIVTELRTLKELAINAANDHNTDQDRATLQKTFDQRRANIDDIANTTNYNGKLLLDGTYQRPPEEISEEVSEDELTMTEPEGTPIVISGTGYYSISNDGVYVIGSGYSGTITIQNGASNVKLQQENPSVALSEVYINCPTSGNTNLWIENLNITNTKDASAIWFRGANNFLTLKGTNILNETNTPSISSLNGSLINIGDGLTMEGCLGSVLSITSQKAYNYGALVGTKLRSSTSANLTINSGTYNISGMYGCQGAGIGSGAWGRMGDITINGGRLTVNIKADNVTGAAIGSGFGGSTGNITIGKNSVINATSSSNYSIAGAGIGDSSAGTVGDIIISKGATVTASSISSSSSVFYIDDDSSADTKSSSDNPLVLHTGTKAGQAIMCYIEDMHCEAMGIKDTSVNTRDEAVSAIDEIDSAIEYALDEATTIGSYISRLEYTKENIVTAAENTQASESTIRDADMAKEMVSYTKNKVLAQAAQSMLAQSNQNVSNVLSLLSG